MMRGFFERQPPQTPYRSEKGMHSCVSCGLYQFVRSPRMKPYGEFGKRIMVIGEGPGEDEDQKGHPWQGRTGRVLQRQYRELGVDLFRDCVSLNAVNCRPVDKGGRDRTPTEYEIACCRQKVVGAVQEYQPKLILLHGGAALSSLIGYRWKRELGGITKWAGQTIPDANLGAWVCPTFHPSYIEHQEGTSEVDILWRKDLGHAFAKATEPLPKAPWPEEVVEVSQDAEGVLRRLYEEKPALLAFDIETTGLKPYDVKAHETISISFCSSPDKAHAIPFPTQEGPLRLLRRILESPKIGKIAANMKYEDTWLTIMHGIQVKPWAFDTMLAAHLLDNKPGITGLKFQAYVRFGVLGYDEETAPYLKSSGPYKPNRVREFAKTDDGLHRLLLYNGMDAFLTYRLAMEQMEALGMEKGE